MEIEYSIEVFDPQRKKYVQVWHGNSIDWLNKMYNKPYNTKHTRRAIKVTKEVLFQDKGKK